MSITLDQADALPEGHPFRGTDPSYMQRGRQLTNRRNVDSRDDSVTRYRKTPPYYRQKEIEFDEDNSL